MQSATIGKDIVLATTKAAKSPIHSVNQWRSHSKVCGSTSVVCANGMYIR